MTEIHTLTGLPAEDRGPRHVQAGGRNPLFVALTISTVILTVMNLAAAVYLLKAAGEVRTVEQRLAELAEVESRIKARLEGMNNGLQNQFDEQNATLQVRFDDIERAFSALDKSLADMRRAEVWAPPPADPASALMMPPMEEAGVEAPAAIARPPAAKKPAARPAPEASAAYQRFESTDGKVYYRKIR
ncbi:hypothetical protein [Nitratireductor luteus]|uniref:hypothetical protein n=1 Tax=Nitratireductor luteus TaxID=2976980 RepID=UPI00223EC7F1|nr:hypothetical protein [Nitratireductor luteus]